MSRNLRDVIAPDSRSDAYDVRKTSSARACRFTVGGIELEYCQPLTDHGALARHLEEYGQGVIACVFGAARVDDVLARLARTSIGVALAPDLLGERTDGARFEIAGRSIVGFDIVIEDVDEQALADAS
jgi:hypothetical protein